MHFDQRLFSCDEKYFQLLCLMHGVYTVALCDICRLVLQIICFTATVTATNSASSITYWPDVIPAVTWAVSLVWPVIVISIYELVKRREIK